jgi:hypothetical protein
MFPLSVSSSASAPALRSSLTEQLQGLIFVSIWLPFRFPIDCVLLQVEVGLVLSYWIKKLKVS